MRLLVGGGKEIRTPAPLHAMGLLIARGGSLRAQ